MPENNTEPEKDKIAEELNKAAQELEGALGTQQSTQQQGAASYNEAEMESSIDALARKVSIKDLQKRGKQEVKVVRKSALLDLIQQAVKNAVAKYTVLPVSGEVIDQESQKEFAELYEQYKTALSVQSELAAKKGLMSKELEEVRKELEIHKKLSQQTISEEEEKRQIVAFKEFEFQIEKVVKKIIERKKAGTGISAEELENEMRPIIAKLAKEIYSTYASSAYLSDRTIQLLEKRIERLYEYAASLENVLKMLATQKLYTNSQIATLMTQLGILKDDPFAEKKKEMLKIIVDQNVKLRKDIAALEQSSQPAAVSVSGGQAASPPPDVSGNNLSAADGSAEGGNGGKYGR